MNCKQIRQCTDDYLDGVLPVGEQHLVSEHLAECDACRTEINQLQELRHALRSLPVPPPSADFRNRVFAQVRQIRHKRQRLLGGLTTAIAASLVMWIGVALFQPASNTTGIQAIAMGISDTREVKLVFNAPEAFQRVTFKLELSDNIELTGFAGRKGIEWQTALKQGSNTLVLPITATGHGQAEVVAKIVHEGKTRTFRIPVKVQGSGAQLQQIQIPIPV